MSQRRWGWLWVAVREREWAPAHGWLLDPQPYAQPSNQSMVEGLVLGGKSWLNSFWLLTCLMSLMYGRSMNSFLLLVPAVCPPTWWQRLTAVVGGRMTEGYWLKANSCDSLLWVTAVDGRLTGCYCRNVDDDDRHTKESCSQPSSSTSQL